MTRSRSISSAALLVATCGALAWPVPVHGQAPQGTQPGSKTKVVRRPVVDLKKQAEQPRPGQVMPGQPAPTAPATEPAPAPADASGEQPPADGASPADAQAPAAAPAATPAPTPADARPAVDIPDQSSQAATQSPPAGPKPLKPAPVPVAPPPPVRTEPEPVALPAAVEPATPAARVRPEPEPLPILIDEPVARPASDAAPARPAPEPKAEPARVGATAIARPGESVEVRVGATEGPADVVEWRAMGEDWSPVAKGLTANGRIEVRTGLGAAATFTLDGQVDVKVLRLSRVRFERREPSGPGMPAEIVVEVNRGEVDIKPKPGLVAGAATAVIRIVTSDKNFATRLPTGVRYDAFTGTRIKVLSAER